VLHDHWFGSGTCIGFVVGSGITLAFARARRVEVGRIFHALLGALLGCVAGAGIGYIVFLIFLATVAPLAIGMEALRSVMVTAGSAAGASLLGFALVEHADKSA
jgi:prolipoprotein diacylglyceryltransferase